MLRYRESATARRQSELNNDGMIKLSDIHYNRTDLINNDSSFCWHWPILFAVDLQCHVFPFEKLLLNVRPCL